MVTAILPSLTTPKTLPRDGNSDAREVVQEGSAPSSGTTTKTSSPEPAGKLAGFVGLFTGLGALIALFVFLPLPARFEESGSSKSNAIALSFFVVASIAGVVSCICSLGLRDLPGEEGKKLTAIFSTDADKHSSNGATLRSLRAYHTLLLDAISLGIKDVNIGLAYAGGFVARASSVAISLFIPLFVNHHFLETGRCPSNPDGNSSKESCRRAYIVASMLTGVSQLVALLCAPLFGHLTSQYSQSNLPLLLAAASGVAGYASFGMLRDPDPKGEQGSSGVFFIVALIGISQIGAIVCSLALLAQGVQEEDVGRPGSLAEEDSESAPLMQAVDQNRKISRQGIKGSVAGVYSLSGGAGILLLTKVGGLLFDKADTGSPFFIMSAFNCLLLAIGVVCAVINLRRASPHEAIEADQTGNRDGLPGN
jgi:MFS family permease